MQHALFEIRLPLLRSSMPQSRYYSVLCCAVPFNNSGNMGVHRQPRCALGYR